VSSTRPYFPNILNEICSSGELLLDQHRFEDAVEKFEKAVELEKEKYVKALYFFHCFSLNTPVIEIPPTFYLW